MKKFIAIVIGLALCMSFAGCSHRVTAEESNEILESLNAQLESLSKELEDTPASITEAPTETVTETEPINEPPLGHADLNIPDAKEYDVIEWPTYGIVTNIPVPTWSDRGTFYGSPSDETAFWAEIGYTTLNDYEGYVEMCKACGFTNDIQEDPGSSFIAYNEDGYMIDLLYVPWSKYMDIQLTY